MPKRFFVKCSIIGLAFICFYGNANALGVALKRFIDTTKKQGGYIKIREIDRYFYITIPDSVFNRDILVVTRIVKAAIKLPNNDLKRSGFSGTKMIEQVIRFEKDNDSIHLVFANYKTNIHSSGYRPQSNATIAASWCHFLIQDSSGSNYTVNATELIASDNSILYLTEQQKTRLGLNGFLADSSFVKLVVADTGNVEIKTLKAFKNHQYLELSTSLLLLSKNVMPIRYQNERLNYFTQELPAKSLLFQEHKDAILRWRLEPKFGEIYKYNKGILVEPQKPIVFYLDSTIPKKWIPYFLQAVYDWSAPLERAGFKNAIQAKIAPQQVKEDLFSLYDARISVIHYLESSIGDATYSTVVDPRTGEIIQSHIFWSTGCEKLHRNLYFVQASPSDIRARKMNFDDELTGQLIRRVIAHEIGHALGFDHNMIACDAVPVEKMRNKKWVEKNGFTPSIMDYGRFNYVAQPEDHVIKDKGLMFGIGEYDKWAIKWGYSYFADFAPEEEITILNDWVIKRSQFKKFRYLGDSGQDPRTIPEALGNNAMKSGRYGIKNLKFILQHWENWIGTSIKAEIKNEQKDIYTVLVNEYILYIAHAAANIGGFYQAILPTERQKYIPGEIQKQALSFISQNLVDEPGWLFNKDILQSMNLKEDSLARQMLETVVEFYLLPERKITNLVAMAGSENSDAMSLEEYFLAFREMLFERPISSTRSSNYQDIFKEIYIKSLTNLRDNYSGETSLRMLVLKIVTNEIDIILSLN